jgi:hypothetical protein
MNYCELPDDGKKLYLCGWKSRKSPIGECRFAEPCSIYMSDCVYYACGACISFLAQKDARSLHEAMAR